jgi:anti-sigma regulatory factor (Ser/Thr protein kinase)
VVTIVLPDTTQSPGLARRSVEQFSHEEGLSSGDSSLALIVSELVTNAVEYGATPIELRLEHSDGVVTIEVTDGRTGPQPQMRGADRTAPSGRGLRIVAALAREWGVRTTATGKVVWARVRVGAPRPQLA